MRDQVGAELHHGLNFVIRFACSAIFRDRVKILLLFELDLYSRQGQHAQE